MGSVEQAVTRYTRVLALRTPVERVWTTLTDPARLARWLADEGVLELHTGGVFEPCGPHCVTPEGARGEMLEVSPGRGLELRWPIGGKDTRLSFRLEPDGPDTRLTIAHTAQDGWPTGLDVPSLWALQLTHLRMAAEHGALEALPLRVDFTQTPAGLVWLGLSISALPARIYGLLTVQEALRGWLGLPARIELREKGRIDFGLRGRGPTTVQGLKKNRLLVHGWRDGSGSAESRVTWSIMPEMKGSRVEFLHEGLAAELEPAYRLLWSAALLLVKDCAENDRSVGLGWSGEER